LFNLFISGVILIGLGWIWGLLFPLNKPLWTSSYVLYTAGLAILVLVLFYWLIDVKGWRVWSKFFVVYGLNPLFVFVLSVLWVKVLIYVLRFESDLGDITNGYQWLYHSVFLPFAGELNGSLLFAVAHVLLFWLVAFLLHKSKIYIKI
jgi:predicted acyltransferase